MAGKKKSSKLGFDPLAWMKGGSEPVQVEEKPVANETAPEPVEEKPETPVANETAPEPVEEKPETPVASKTSAPVPGMPKETVVHCGDALGIEDVAGLKERLSAALQSGGAVVLDAAAIHSAQTPGMQLFVAFVRAAEEKGLRIEWKDPSEVLKDSARLLGLSDILKLAA